LLACILLAVTCGGGSARRDLCRGFQSESPEERAAALVAFVSQARGDPEPPSPAERACLSRRIDGAADAVAEICAEHVDHLTESVRSVEAPAWLQIAAMVRALAPVTDSRPTRRVEGAYDRLREQCAREVEGALSGLGEPDLDLVR
jgi:hypothetical protein